MFRHVLVPTDGSELWRRAVDRAIAFARDAGARLTLRTEGLGHPLAPLAELVIWPVGRFRI